MGTSISDDDSDDLTDYMEFTTQSVAFAICFGIEWIAGTSISKYSGDHYVVTIARSDDR